jgi:GH25 family lysozyme M1 (1,4-beta-N-acetylmuramidase)
VTDTATIERAPQLEPHVEFEGVGAHELNPRFQNVDGYDGWDDGLWTTSPARTPALFTARSLLAQGLVGAVAPVLHGPDVAHYQYEAGAPIDWPTVRTACVWAAAKLTQSTGYLDPTAARSRLSMTAMEFPHRGLYHWLSSTTDPEKQAAWYLRNLASGLVTGEFSMLDAEENGITVEMALAWLEAVEAVIRRPCVVYTGVYVAAGSIWSDPRLRESKWGMRPFIVAAYTTEARMRALPGIAARPPQAWQFSSNGPVPGVTGRCDMNTVFDFPAFDLAAGHTPESHPAPPVIQEDDMPATAKNTQPRALDGQTYDPGVIHWEITNGVKRHITTVAELKAYGGTERAVGLDNAELDSIPDWQPPTVTGPAPTTYAGTLDIASVPGKASVVLKAGS